MNRLIGKELLKNAIHEVDILGEGKNEKDAFANAFEKIKVVAYQLSEDLLISMKVIGVKINAISDNKKKFLTGKNVLLDLKITIEYNFLDIKSNKNNKKGDK